MSGFSPATFSKVGAKLRQGPHQGAQKSMTTMSFPEIVVSNCSVDKAVTDMVGLPK
jgi:hypothetical protein